MQIQSEIQSFMKILIAPDKFKDAASAADICIALQKGILQTFPSAICTLAPLADGGEGTLESIALALHAEWVVCSTKDPFFNKIEAKYLFIPSKKMAVIETARASGIELVKPQKRNCLLTSSIGTGILIKDAIQKGAKEIILTVGGTATNDAAIGIANALGFEFLNKNGETLTPIGRNLLEIHQIDDKNVVFDKNEISFTIATDVENPFYGQKGAAFVFARQKGADDSGIELLDYGLKNYASILHKYSSINPQSIAGSGAGGGIGGGMAALFNAKIISAADWIIRLNDIEKHISESQILITGEGKVDSQTWDGKLISRLLNLASNYHVPVIAICGTLQDVELIAQKPNVLYATSILQAPISLKKALKETHQLVEQQGLLLGKLLQRISFRSE